MDLKLYKHHLDAFMAECPNRDDIKNKMRFVSSGDSVTIDSSIFSKEDLEFLNAYAKKDTKAKGSNYLVQMTNFAISLYTDDVGAIPFTDLRKGKDIFGMLFKEMGKPYLFRRSDHGSLEKYLVTNISYSAGTNSGGYYEPAKFKIELLVSIPVNERKADNSRGGTVNRKSIIFHVEDIKGKKRGGTEHLADKGFFLYDEKHEAEYIGMKELANELRSEKNYGKQYVLASGVSKIAGRWYGHTNRLNVLDGEPDKAIMDTTYADLLSEHSKLYSNPGDVDGKWDIPVVNDVFLFSLRHHDMVRTYVTNIEPYEYDASVGDKLVLEDSTRNFIDIAINSASSDVTDIISGKSKGKIFILSGPPGVGKTLTVEVISEVYQMPVYQVQCSQLGVTHSDVQSNLGDILRRASKWKCILYFDEADVYLNRRGDDLVQNAIVGVFLVALERYNGVLFMSTNRGDMIDDAILSRAMAHIRYGNPDYDATIRIFKVLAEQFNVPYTDDNLVSITNYLHNKSDTPDDGLADKVSRHLDPVSGRDILSLLKMAKPFVKQGRRLDRNLIEFLMTFKS